MTTLRDVLLTTALLLLAIGYLVAELRFDHHGGFAWVIGGALLVVVFVGNSFRVWPRGRR